MLAGLDQSGLVHLFLQRWDRVGVCEDVLIGVVRRLTGGIGDPDRSFQGDAAEVVEVDLGDEFVVDHRGHSLPGVI